jgi:hypothetical protein
MFRDEAQHHQRDQHEIGRSPSGVFSAGRNGRGSHQPASLVCLELGFDKPKKIRDRSAVRHVSIMRKRWRSRNVAISAIGPKPLFAA